jgi:2-polyprenyl-3-methyl-5-hydroxy-6-metoxy-1,4-benzoquinol methylase
MPHYRLHRDLQSSHGQIAAHVRRLGLSPVLDVGAAQGFLGQLLQGSGIVIDAVEPDADCCELCRPYYRNVHLGTVESAGLTPSTYRLIVCGDVLEHTVNPVAVLKQLKTAATPDAIFIVSVPNVAHLAVRMLLLTGKFPRMDRGILDATHLHFFTRETAGQMLKDAGLQAQHVSATPVPLDELWPAGQGSPLYNFAEKTQHAAVRLLPRLFGMQWVFVAALTRNGSVSAISSSPSTP